MKTKNGARRQQAPDDSKSGDEPFEQQQSCRSPMRSSAKRIEQQSVVEIYGEDDVSPKKMVLANATFVNGNRNDKPMVLRVVTTLSDGVHSETQSLMEGACSSVDNPHNESIKISSKGGDGCSQTQSHASPALVKSPPGERSADSDGLAEMTSTVKKRVASKNAENSRKRSRKVKSQQSAEEIEFELSWICSECKEAECMVDPSAEQLLICEGRCHRLFHFPCAGLPKLPDSNEPWLCADCKDCRHRCILCHEYGVDDEEVFCCEKGRCGLFFHESCLTMSNIDYSLVGNDEDEVDDDVMTKESAAKRLCFSCPAHGCWTCKQNLANEGEDDPGETKLKKSSKKSATSAAYGYKTEGRLFRCMECPRAYHVTCVPPLARFHELALLCHEHSSIYKLPDLDIDNSVQKAVEADVDRKFRKAFSESGELPKRRRPDQELCLANIFFLGVRGDLIADNEKLCLEEVPNLDGSPEKRASLLFYLPCELKDEVHAKPPPYRHLNALKYIANNRPKRLPPSGEICNCSLAGSSSCGEDCMNRVLGMECTGDGNGSKNLYSNCSVGPMCGNRAIGKRKSAKCRPVREGGRGWGLIAVDKVGKGDFVQEYGGEVIDEKTKVKRLNEWATEHPNDPNFYIMSLQQGWYIDARNKSNLARFINHSCDPNCRVLQMNVGGYLHMGIYALRDIAPGEFLSYDYHFDTRHGDKFRCRCGSKICRGTMKSGKSQTTTEKKTKTEIWDEAKARYDRDKKFLDDVYETEAKRLFLVDALVPGANGNEEAVANGPQARHREFALRSRLFLWRSVLRGSDFVSRFSRKKPSNFITKPLNKLDVISLVEQQRKASNGKL